VSCYPKSGIHI